MKTRIAIIVLFFTGIFLFPEKGLSQSSAFCYDSTYYQPGYSCPGDYNPVCGCNGVTYRNSCAAERQNGIIGYTEGICGYLDVFIASTFVTDQLYYNFYAFESGTINIILYDLPLGNIKYATVVQASKKTVTTNQVIDVSSLPTGLYLLQFEKDGQEKTFKVYIYNYNYN